MRIKIGDYETPAELMLLSGFLRELALIRKGTQAENAAMLLGAPKADPIPLTEGDAPTQFDVSAATEPVAPPAADASEVPSEVEPTKRTRRTRAQIAADKLAAAPAAPVDPDGKPAVNHGEAYPYQAPEVPAAPLAPAVPAAPPGAGSSVPVVNATNATLPTPTTPSAPTGDAPTTFPTLMRALNPALASKKLTAEALNEACAQAGCTNLQGLLQRQGLVPTVYALVAGALS